MIVEVVSVGTELLLGDIVDTNAALIGRRLREDGFDVHFHVVVGDNLARVVETLRLALARSDAVIVTGGIGPTNDDLTREALAGLAGVDLHRDEAHAAWLGERIRSQGSEPGPSALRMADVPAGAEPMPNTSGAALGVALEIDGRWLYAMPGVPAELVPMLDGEVMPRLRRLAGAPATLFTRTLRCWGLGEAAIGDRLEDLFSSTNPSLSYLVDDMEVLVRITAKDRNETAAVARIAAMEEEVRRRLGDLVFGSDEETVERLVFESLSLAEWSVGVVDAATFGLVAARLHAADPGGLFAGAVIPGSGALEPPTADVVVHLGPIGPMPEDGGTTRTVEVDVTTPLVKVGRTFELGGDDERVRAFAVGAALHVLRLALGHTLR